MTFSEFFLNQTTQDIIDQFKRVKLNDYRNVPESIHNFCSIFGLTKDKDEICDLYVIKRHSTAEIYINFLLPNPSFPECPIFLDTVFYAKSRRSGCSITRGHTMGFHESTVVFRKESDMFDDRPEYNNIEYTVEMEYLTDVRKLYKTEFFSSYVLDENKTILDLYNSICQHVKGVAPLIKMFVDSTENGLWENLWNSLMPRDKWKRGHDVLRGMASSIILMNWYRAVKAGIEPNFEEFVKYYVAIICCRLIPDGDNPLMFWDSNDEDVVKKFKEILSEFDEKYTIDDSMKKWNEVYSNANKEFIDEFDKLKQKISKKYGINEKYLDNFKIINKDNRSDLNWKDAIVPEDAYIE